MRIILICGGGASSGFMVNAMIKAAKNRGKDIEIKARSEMQLTAHIQEIDFVLCAPHMRAQEETIEGICKTHDVPYAFIEPMDFAMMQGDKVLDFVLETYEESKK